MILSCVRNDAHAALAIAAATRARFIRVNVHTGTMYTDQGVIEGQAAHTMRTRAALAPEVAILADVHVKHASPPPGSTLELAAKDTWHRGLADALVVSGSGTGEPTGGDDVRRIKTAVPGTPVLVGSGVTTDNAEGLLESADGAIVGSAAMVEGKAGGPIDPERARAVVEAARASA